MRVFRELRREIPTLQNPLLVLEIPDRNQPFKDWNSRSLSECFVQLAKVWCGGLCACVAPGSELLSKGMFVPKSRSVWARFKERQSRANLSPAKLPKHLNTHASQAAKFNQQLPLLSTLAYYGTATIPDQCMQYKTERSIPCLGGYLQQRYQPSC